MISSVIFVVMGSKVMKTRFGGQKGLFASLVQFWQGIMSSKNSYFCGKRNSMNEMHKINCNNEPLNSDF